MLTEGEYLLFSAILVVFSSEQQQITALPAFSGKHANLWIKSVFNICET